VVARSASLLAAVLLLFGLPHCAIDDRNLKEQDGDDSNGGSSNGGSSNGGSSSGGTAGNDPLCAPDPQNDECQNCARDRCCAQYVDCIMNPDCDAYVACGRACPDADDACFDACDDQYPIGSALFYGFAACGLTECPDLCSS
jgi:hypothetical protein